MFYHWRRALPAARFRRQIAPILATEPLRLSKRGVTIVSMVATSDLAPYLLALKSLCTCIEVGKVVAIIDRDSPPDLRHQLSTRIPGIELVEIESIPVGICQHGGTWERLLYVLDRSEHEYVVQLDADTLTLGPDLAEAAACIAENRSFTLGGGPAGSGQNIVSMPEAAAKLKFESDYIGIVMQQRLNEYPGAETLRYVRGSSGFCGFARGGIGRQRIEEFHSHMARLLDVRWTEWGTEQCASNFAIANTPGAVVLPWPAYANFQPERQPSVIESARFLHFLGLVRYRDGCYARLGQNVIDRIMAAQQVRPAA
ncbi:MAG: hypothetical protein ACREFZ_08585 [Acetobacteraceae bacterium]